MTEDVKSILRKEIRQIINEYVTNDSVYLKNYLQMNDEQRARDIAYHYEYMFGDFFEDFPNKDDEKYNDVREDIEANDLGSALETAESNHIELFNAFAEYAKETSSDDTDAPTHQHMGFEKIVKNQWLIHFSDDADEIERNGFKYGNDEIERLGYTTYRKKESKKYGGYNFAYTIDDFKIHAKDGSDYKYGEEAVVFIASGVKVWHFGDEEPQVIFYGNTAKNINAIYKSSESGEWYIDNKKTGNTLYKNENLENVVDWFISHYNQYRKVLN